MACDLRMFFMITFSLGFMLGKALRWETFPKCKVGFHYCLIRGIFFWLYLTQQDLFSDWGEVVVLMRTQISCGHIFQTILKGNVLKFWSQGWYDDVISLMHTIGSWHFWWRDYLLCFDTMFIYLGFIHLLALPSHTNLDMKRQLTYGWFASSYPSYLYKRRMILS